jgi:hypothetical protein
MSEYGRVWESIAIVRRALKEAVPGLDTSTLAKARLSVSLHTGHLEDLLSQWARLERLGDKVDE